MRSLNFFKQHRNQPLRVNKRHISLIEVVISFAIITLCIIPLIYPHVYIYKKQHEAVHKIELQNAAQLVYSNVYHKLLKNEIAWNDIEIERIFPITKEELKALAHDSLPFIGKYQLAIVRQKVNESVPLSTAMLKLSIAFAKNEEMLSNPDSTNRTVIEYTIFAARNLQGSAVEQNEEPPKTSPKESDDGDQ